MTLEELRRFYDQKKQSYAAELENTNKKIAVISNARLVIAVIFIALLYFGLDYHILYYGIPFAVAGFIILVKKHAKHFNQRNLLQNLVDIQNNELRCLDGDFSRNSSGSKFIDVTHPYSHDLDIFGEGSLFQYLNRAETSEGKKAVAGRLSAKPGALEDVRRWQEAVDDLAARPRLRQQIQALSMQVEEDPSDRAQLHQWLSEPAFVFGKKSYKLILTVFPLITVVLIVLSFFLDGAGTFAILAAGVQWAFLGFHLKRVNKFHQYVSRKKNTLGKYALILEAIRTEEYRSPLMTAIRERAQNAGDRLGRLASLVGALDARLNSMTNLFVNSILLYDLQCVYRLEQWKEENAEHLIGWLDTVGEMEALCSFGTFAYNHPEFKRATVNDEGILTATGLGHPLLSTSDRVVNDVSLDRQASVMIITGANMAGKSTFLRALGVNVVLALAGCPVCASYFNCPFIDIRSGMRTADSLKESQSYFYAELNRLRSIMEELRAGNPLLILLDEILKGTNSTDKQAGSIALVKQLVAEPCLVVIATHDLVLGELEQEYPQRVLNYSFEAAIEDDHLHFDYKLKRGIAQKMNATFLMKKMGIITG